MCGTLYAIVILFAHMFVVSLTVIFFFCATRKPSLAVAPTTLASFLANCRNRGGVLDLEKLFTWLLVIYSFQSTSAFQPLSAITAVAELLFSSCDHEL